MTSRRIALWSVLALLFFAQTATAVVVSPDVEFQLDQNIVKYATEQDFDSIYVDSNTLTADENSMSVSATSPINITIDTFNESYVAYNTSAALSSSVTMQLSSLVHGEWSIYSDLTRLTTDDSDGSITYSYTAIGSHAFEALPTSTVQVTSDSVASDTTAFEISQTQNVFYSSITETISSGYILGSLLVLVLGGAAILRFLGYV